MDDLAFIDFLILVDGCQHRLDAREKAAKAGVWVG